MYAEHGVDVTVIGGGLGGLAAAALCAGAGASVRLIERSRELGGRARTREQAGFFFNLGAHALYLDGPGQTVLDELGVHYNGGEPRLSRYRALVAGRLHLFPSRAGSLLRTGLFGAQAKVEISKAFRGLRRLDPAAYSSVPLGDFLETHFPTPEVRDFARAVIRLTTYTAAPDDMSAALAVQALGNSRPRVRYLNGGWRTLVDGLQRSAKDCGVRIETSMRVERLALDSGRVCGVQTEDGRLLKSSAIILACGVRDAARLLVTSGVEAAKAWLDAVPQKVAALEVGLSRLPAPRSTFALGVDRPVYLSVHSDVARLAPRGGASVSLARYLMPGENDPAAAKSDLEGLVDRVQPGWRDYLVWQQWLPSVTVHSWLPLACEGGLQSRPGLEVEGAEGLYLAGDWVDRCHFLADGVLHSAHDAAALAVVSARSSRLEAVASA